MRPDLRSFSFTWTKGGGTEEPNRSKSIPNFGNSTSDPYQSGKIRKEKEKKKIDKKNYYGCNPSKLRQLKEFGTSFLQFGQSKVAMATKTEYFTIHEEPIEMTDEEEEENSKNENLDPKNDEIEKKSMTLRSANLKNSNSNSNSIGIGGKINKKVQNVKNTFGNLSQVRKIILF
jgi:hypothetical protein